MVIFLTHLSHKKTKKLKYVKITNSDKDYFDSSSIAEISSAAAENLWLGSFARQHSLFNIFIQNTDNELQGNIALIYSSQPCPFPDAQAQSTMYSFQLLSSHFQSPFLPSMRSEENLMVDLYTNNSNRNEIQSILSNFRQFPIRRLKIIKLLNYQFYEWEIQFPDIHRESWGTQIHVESTFTISSYSDHKPESVKSLHLLIWRSCFNNYKPNDFDHFPLWH